MDSGKRFALGLGVLVVAFAAMICFMLFSPDEQWRDKYYYDLCSSGCDSYQPETSLTQKLGPPSRQITGPAHIPVPANAAVFAPTGHSTDTPASLPDSLIAGQHLDIFQSPTGKYALFVVIGKDGKDMTEACVSK